MPSFIKTLFKNGLRSLSALIIVLTFLSYLAPLVNPANFRYLVFFGTAYPWWALLNIAMLLLWVWRLDRFALYHVVILAFGWSYFTAFFGLHFGKEAIPEAHITLVTHNLGHLFRGNEGNDEAVLKEKAAEYAAFLKKNGLPDILCTQETKGTFYRLLAEQLGYAHNFNLKKGTVILSRYPIEAGGDIPLGKTSNSTLWVHVRLPQKGLVRVYNVHLQSNKVTTDAEKVLDQAESGKENNWNDIRRVLEKVEMATSRRSEQVQLLKEHIEACELPVILCGDFNDTPNSYTYHSLSQGMWDTYQERGTGFGTTFAGRLPLLRIDYILHSPAYCTFSCRVVKDKRWSDHYPVWAILAPAASQ